MSWVDLAALTVMLWHSANGYLLGGRQMVLRFCGLVAALLVALYLQKPFSLYLSLEWQAERFFGRLISRSLAELLHVGATGSFDFQLPPLAGAVMQRLAEEPETIAAFSQVAASQAVGEMMIRFLAVIVFFYFLAVAFTLILRVGRQKLKCNNITESQRFSGLIIGSLCGLLLSLLCCVLLDALSIFTASAFLGQDLSGSYLYLVTAHVLAFIL
ncbi:MAG: hypothetical protein KGZ54_07805 [Dethiobacter sp.]|jgi:ABC-type multidrug transport system fused ATPase/permease subunit|nr:hypothetical protein [Dethiobacter sp.]MBS3901902.1 hypothetical protein [Dethiobacter sp.]MBS3988826.1 hypothetical protein [Dethiobacter sp.]